MIVNTDDNNKKFNSCGKYGSRGERFMFLRNILNIIFMLGALIGMVIYFKWIINWHNRNIVFHVI